VKYPQVPPLAKPAVFLQLGCSIWSVGESLPVSSYYLYSTKSGSAPKHARSRGIKSRCMIPRTKVATLSCPSQ
jgi:hypothetical protein